MKELHALYQAIGESLARKENVALATVIARSGSGPREAGASMMVSNDGRTLGTVGGGLLEAQVTEIGRQVLSEHRSQCRTFSLAERQVDVGGMICGGEMEVLVECFEAADPACVRIVDKVLADQEGGRPSWIVRSIRIAEPDRSVQSGIGLMDDTRLDQGSLDLSCTDTKRLTGMRRKEESVLVTSGDIRYFIQPSGLSETVFIFGAGHIAQELAPICSALGFRTVVVDDRREYANAVRFPTATETVVTDSYEDCFGRLAFSLSSFIVIVTHAHAHDRIVLSHAMKTPAGYIGMIASRRKREMIFASLREEGVSDADLTRVHSPIGLSIGAQTPAEIAVSIAAELIAVRTGTLP
jgi:xanthine dehydrogenase accessory factor